MIASDQEKHAMRYPPIVANRKPDRAPAAADEDAIDWLIRQQDAPDDGGIHQAFDHWHNQPQHAQASAALQRTDDIIRTVEARRKTKRRTIGGVMGTASLCAALVIVPEAALCWRANARHRHG
jgi:ferric-dicitrate binding protein FerR (iron transport regulator)